jgi:hypothetical protein
MKLSAELADRTVDRFGARVIPESHPAIPQLHTMFGDHTFFVDGAGLHILEPADRGPADAAAGQVVAGQVVKVASWADAEQTTLAPHEPEPTNVVVEFDTGGPVGRA